MKLYRNQPWTEEDSSGGYRWFLSKKEAMHDFENSPGQYDDMNSDVAEEFELELTKRGVLAFLNKVAGHPDNG